ncbi:SDR family oxidoreductase [Haloarcula nitratireducens]|uniref:SDR family oxidoreductase n=1 Tax=Haloarcula nitratireducens TaxID=2487749 RepID=A0AAW4PED3_9EURY|nr:SDR family oxidoreductase [Halomicroarcula nitratireducens]MBX0295968.1 SDR family oxidoreductase [Halomicroarcula nitratireducens]
MVRDSLAERCILVTGASSGIGAATVRRVASDGADVALLARREGRLRELADDVAEEFDVATHVVPADVSDPAQVAAAVESTVETLGSLDGVVVNAGLGRGDDVETMTDDEYRTMMDVNVDGAFYTARESLSYLRESAGILVFIGSFAGQYPRPSNPVYAATKWWLRGFAMSLSGQVGGEEVGVTVVNPTEVRSEFGSEEGESFEDRFDPGEVTEPEEVADAVAFALAQEPPTMINDIDVYRRDKFGGF